MKLNFTYTDELYHYGVKGMHWGVRKDRPHGSKKRYNRVKDMAGRVLKNDHIGAVKNFIKSRKEYNKKLQADVEWDGIFDKEFNKLVDGDPKARSLNKKWSDASRELGKSENLLRTLENNGMNHSDPKKYDSAYEKYEMDYDRYHDSMDEFFIYTSKYDDYARQLANSTIKRKYGYTEADFREPEYAQKALIDKGSIKYERESKASNIN